LRAFDRPIAGDKLGAGQRLDRHAHQEVRGKPRPSSRTAANGYIDIVCGEIDIMIVRPKPHRQLRSRHLEAANP